MAKKNDEKSHPVQVVCFAGVNERTFTEELLEGKKGIIYEDIIKLAEAMQGVQMGVPVKVGLLTVPGGPLSTSVEVQMVANTKMESSLVNHNLNIQTISGESVSLEEIQKEFKGKLWKFFERADRFTKIGDDLFKQATIHKEAGIALDLAQIACIE